jgi:hypothetical protein
LREATLGELSAPFYFLIAFTVVAMSIAAMRFSKRLD